MLRSSNSPRFRSVDGPFGLLNPVRHLANGAGSALDHAHAVGLERADDGFRTGPVFTPDFLGRGLVPMIVHPITSRCDRRTKPQHVVRHPRQKPGRALAAPAELSHLDPQLRRADSQVGLDNPRIHLLFGDRVPADGQSDRPPPQLRACRRSRRERLINREIRIVGQGTRSAALAQNRMATLNHSEKQRGMAGGYRSAIDPSRPECSRWDQAAFSVLLGAPVRGSSGWRWWSGFC